MGDVMIAVVVAALLLLSAPSPASSSSESPKLAAAPTPTPVTSSSLLAPTFGVLNAALPALQKCNTNGLVAVTAYDLAINDAGAVDDVVRASNHSESAVAIAPCVVAQLRALTFAPGRALLRARFAFAATEVNVGDLLVVASSAVDLAVRVDAATPADIAATLAPHRPALEQCYRDVRRTSPSVGGSLLVRLTVGADGAVVADTVLHPSKLDATAVLHVPLQSCVRAVLRSARYPTATTTRDVSVRLEFLPPSAPSITALEREFVSRWSALMRCHPTGVPSAPLVLEFTITDTGAATDVVPPGNLDAACAIAAVEGTSWRAPSNGTVRVGARFKVHHGGGLARGEIQRVVSSTMARIKRCYDVELAREPTLQGTLTLLYRIGPDGSVIDVETLRPTKPDAVELTDPNVVACIVDIIRRHRYPRPIGGGVVNVTYPFVFSSSAPAIEHAL